MSNSNKNKKIFDLQNVDKLIDEWVESNECTVYKKGEEVYLKTDIDQLLRIVTEILIKPGCLMYKLSCGIDETWHYDFEISKEKRFN